MKIPENLSKTISEAEHVVLMTHIHPDGDALGSLLGFADILDGMGKNVVCYLEQPVPHLYHFLPNHQRVETSLEDLAEFVNNHQGVVGISLDCGDSDRLGENKTHLLTIEPFLVIDHHQSHRNFGNYRWIEPDCSSTGEMVYELALHLKAKISYDCAYNLYVAISTDTGSFRYDSTSPRTLRIAAELIDKGVMPEEVSGHIHENYTLQRFKLLEMVLETLDMYESNTLAFIHVTQEMFTQSGALPEDIEGFIDFPRSIRGVKVAAFLKENTRNQISVSLRAKGECDVAQVAKSFGGGGHRNAAGFRFTDKNMMDVRVAVLDKLRMALQEKVA